jgi:hypothetical protein
MVKNVDSYILQSHRRGFKMKTKEEIIDKIKQLEEYLEKGKVITELYPLENTESFLGGLKWVLDEELEK